MFTLVVQFHSVTLYLKSILDSKMKGCGGPLKFGIAFVTSVLCHLVVKRLYLWECYRPLGVKKTN